LIFLTQVDDLEFFFQKQTDNMTSIAINSGHLLWLKNQDWGNLDHKTQVSAYFSLKNT